MTIRRLMTAAALLALAAVAAFGQTPVVRVQEQVTVTAPTITLGDLATVEGCDANTAKTLNAIRLGSSPLPGNGRELDRDLFINQLRRSGFTATKVKLQCPRSVRVFRASQTLNQEVLEQKLRDFIDANSPWTSEEMSVGAITAIGDLVLPTGDLDISFSARGNASWLGTTPFVVEISIDGRPVQQTVMQANISVSRDVVVAVNNITVGRGISAEDVTVRRIDITTARGSAFGSIDDVVGLTATSYIASGDVLTDTRVTLPTVVRRGQSISLDAQGEGFVIRITAVAQQDGKVGDTIRVLNPSSKKVLEARVTGAGSATVLY